MSRVRARIYPVLVPVGLTRRGKGEGGRGKKGAQSGASAFARLLPLAADQLASFHVRHYVSGHPVSVKRVGQRERGGCAPQEKSRLIIDAREYDKLSAHYLLPALPGPFRPSSFRSHVSPRKDQLLPVPEENTRQISSQTREIGDVSNFFFFFILFSYECLTMVSQRFSDGRVPDCIS